MTAAAPESQPPALPAAAPDTGDPRILLVVDDTWREQDLSPFMQGGPQTTRLITTRLSRVVPTGAYRQVVDAMKDREARELLSRGLPTDHVITQSKELSDLARRLGEWAQLLKLVNGFLRDRVIEVSEPLRNAIVDANARLTEEGLRAVMATASPFGSRSIFLSASNSAGRCTKSAGGSGAIMATRFCRLWSCKTRIRVVRCSAKSRS